MSRGRLITLEGGEGAGKSTQARALASALRDAGHETVLTREPGGTAGAETLRGVLLDPATRLDPLADTLVHFAARADHATQLIRPALARGAIVVCDRFTDSTMAYQGYGMGVDKAIIDTLAAMLQLTPDLTFVLQVDEGLAKVRLASRPGKADRYELMGDAMMRRIAAGFQAIAAADAGRCMLIDANVDAGRVTEAVLAALRARLGLP